MRFFFLCSILLVTIPVGFAGSAIADSKRLSHSTDFAQIPRLQWVPEPWRVANPDPGAQIGVSDGGIPFVLTTPNTAMAWTLTTTPIWTAPFSTLALSYFVEGRPAEGAGVFIELFDGSTGPITPGATNNENPLASGGRLSCGALTPGLHVELVDLSQVENLDRVAEITVTLHNGDGPLSVRVNQIAFLAEGVPSGASPIALESTDSATATFTPLALPAVELVPLHALETAFGFSADSIILGSVTAGALPFDIRGVAAVTPLDERGGLSVEVGERGAALGLLCATRLWGSGEAWYAVGNATVRSEVSEADPLRFVLQYEDGSVDVGQPIRAENGEAGLRAGLDAYYVVLDANKTLADVSLVDEMSYGQVALIAASVLKSVPSFSGPEQSVVAAERESATEGKVLTGAELLLETPRLRLVLGRDGIVQSFQVGEDRRELATAPFELVTLIAPGGTAYPLAFVDALRVPEENQIVIQWDVAEGRYQFTLSLTVREDGGLLCTPALANLSTEVWTPWAVMPRLTGLDLSRGGTTEYLLGTRGTLQDSAPVDMAEIYGGQFPLQFMDVYDSENGGGLAYIALDDALTRKWFEFKKDDTGRTTMAVSYRNLSLVPGERLALPPVLLLPHEGDWRGPFQEYKRWVEQQFPRTRPNGMKNLFYCRRDYPLGGTTYLYDPAKRGYTYENLISESQWAFGGVDMVDISGWAYNEALGRVGTYLQNDLGGLEALAKGITTGHARGVQTGLYFEGYLLDKRAANAEQGLAEWQLTHADNKPAWWPGEMEFFCCPGAKGWQDALASDIAEVARVTQADAVYVDQLGICGTDKECWAPQHGHPVPSNPIEEEIALLKRVREELDKVRPECAIYIEHIPCDAMTPYIDGAFNMGMKHARNAMGPTKLPLQRYLFPEVPIFEMVAHGIRPIPAEEDDLKLSFFHGMGLWLKGKGASWYSEGFRRSAPAFHAVLTEYKDYFRSPDALPHVDTLMEGVYANKFSHGGKALYTLYNANPHSVDGPMLALGGYGDAKSLLDIAPFGVSFDAAGRRLEGNLPPHGVAAVLAE